jgi:cyclopropane-fatty-acyl-phospholipid synthase
MASTERKALKLLIELAERGILPDRLIRLGIRRLNRKRLCAENRASNDARSEAMRRFAADLRQSPVALQTASANQQHYELPPAFFRKILGRRMKYSGCYWPPGVERLDAAEEAMLALTCERAQVTDGMEVLDLGCGWGSLALWIAEKYPHCRVLAVSNSRLQGEHIRALSGARGMDNVQVATADMNDFHTERRFDRVLSVEMFEHMRNWEALLDRITGWLMPGGKLFVHIFAHRKYAYRFEAEGEDNWMGRLFFSGGIMPADDLLLYFQNRLAVEEHWRINGMHYNRTALAWLNNLDRGRAEVLSILQEHYGGQHAERWLQRWRMFFIACAELFGFRNGEEWFLSHYRLGNG